MLKDDELAVLAQLRDSEAQEIVCDNNACYIDLTVVKRRQVDSLIRMTAVSDISDTGEAALERYALNSTGRAILVNPDIQHSIMDALLTGGAYSITRDGRVIGLG